MSCASNAHKLFLKAEHPDKAYLMGCSRHVLSTRLRPAVILEYIAAQQSKGRIPSHIEVMPACPQVWKYCTDLSFPKGTYEFKQV